MTSTEPELGVSRPRIIRIVVDLPAPLGPRKPVTRPGCDDEGDLVDRNRLSVTLRELLHLDHDLLPSFRRTVGCMAFPPLRVG